MMLSEVCLSNVCLSVAYIGPKSRTERPRTTKIGTEVSIFKIKRSNVNVTGAGAYCGGLPCSLFTLFFTLLSAAVALLLLVLCKSGHSPRSGANRSKARLP